MYELHDEPTTLHPIDKARKLVAILNEDDQDEWRYVIEKVGDGLAAIAVYEGDELIAYL